MNTQEDAVAAVLSPGDRAAIEGLVRVCAAREWIVYFGFALLMTMEE
jgi:hypothetical protein